MSQVSRPNRSAPPRMTSYEDERANYRIEVPEIFNPTVDIVERWAQESPDDLAVVSLDGSGGVVAEQTASDLARDARETAGALLDLGVKKGDPVFIMLPRVPAWYAAMLGAIRIGAIAMPGTNQLTARDISHRITSAGAVAAITDASGVQKIDAIGEDMPTLRHRIAWNADWPDGWRDLDDVRAQAGEGALPSAPTTRDDDILLFFT